MSFIETLATLTVGVVIGLVVALVIMFRKKSVPKPVPVDKLEAWKHLEELTKKKAEIKAQRKALQEALNSGKIDERTYVEESAKLDAREENVEQEISDTMYLVAKGLVPEFLIDEKKEMVKLEEAIKLSDMLKKLKKELEQVKADRDSLYVKISNLEDEKKEILAKYNWLEANSTKRIRELQETVDNLKRELDLVNRENRELKEKLSEVDVPESAKVKSLKSENALLKEELGGLKKKLDVVAKELEMLKTLVSRYEGVIKDKETKTLEEMRQLIDPENEDVKGLIKEYNTPVKAFEYVRDTIKEIAPPVHFPFWMSVGETIRIGAGDNSDRAILLCSLLRALGKDARVLFVETTKGEHRGLVLLNDGGVYYLLDPDKGRKFNEFKGKTREEVLNKYSTGHGSIARIVYEVNDKEAKLGH